MTYESNPSNNAFHRFSQWLKESLVVKLLSIGFLMLMLLIPNAMIQDLIRDRNQRQEEVKAEVSQSWGGSQGIQGPVLAVPYTSWTESADGKRYANVQMAYFLPQMLNVEGDLKHQIRRRSIFDVVLYQAGIVLSGEFQQPDFQAINVNPTDVKWAEARLVVGIYGMTGIKEAVHLDWAGQQRRMEPGAGVGELIPTGVSCPVAIAADGKSYSFNIPIKLNGSEYLSFEPVGKSTTVSLRSDWHSPSFEGGFLPDHRDITASGFTAKWQVLDLNRPYPQQWKNSEVAAFNGSGMAVRLIKPVDEYLKNTRSAKYAILVIGLTFMLYFFFEVLRKIVVHPFQYLLVGLALTVFYLLLLSLSEHLGFNIAYLISAVATIGLICFYSASVLKVRRLVWQLLAMLVAIYGFIFVLLQLEDYALLAGSVGVFIALAAVMASSRKVDWYNLGGRNSAVGSLPAEAGGQPGHRNNDNN
jgi:inner membrane protein